MRLDSPSLVLVFSEAPSSGRGINQSVAGSYIVNQSIRIQQQLLNGLNSSSNQLSLQLTRDCPQITDIIAAEDEVKAVLKNGNETLFTGYLTTNWSWTLTDHGEQALNITIEDAGTRLLSRSFISTGYHLFNCTAEVAINAICTACGIDVSSQCGTVTGNVVKTVDSSSSCRDILDKMLHELGYAFYFDNLGELRVFKIDCTSVSGIPTLDRDKLVVSGGKAISLSKRLRQYGSSKVTYSELGTASDYLVYRNTTGQDTSNPYCHLTLQSHEHFDGTEVYTIDSPDEFREQALIEACNADSETEKVGSNKIVAVSDIRQVVNGDSALRCTISAAGGPYLSIDAYNPTLREYSFSRMDAYGSIIYEKASSIVRTGDAGNCVEETLEYVHDRTTASHLANLLCQYHQNCSGQYTFQSAEDLTCGTIVRLFDNVFSGLDVNVMIYARELRDGCDVIQYSAFGITPFNLDRDTYHRTTDRPRVPTRGKDCATVPRDRRGESGRQRNDKGDKGR